MDKINSTWNVCHTAGESHAVIRVTNLQIVLPQSTDAWGRPNKSQPALITCAVSLRRPFSSASASDTVTESTVHYGLMSKAILGACASLSELGLTTPTPLSQIVCSIQWLLTGMKVKGDPELPPKKPALQAVGMKLLELDITLPKASLLGSGINMKGAFQYNDINTTITTYSMMLSLCHLSIPTLIGVNSNERLAKQIVYATVKIDRCSTELEMNFCELEQLVFKTIEESCFYTLEALAEEIGQRIIRYYICPQTLDKRKINLQQMIWPSIRIQLSKPTAVTFADAPSVEMLIDLNEESTRLERLQSQRKENFKITCTKPEFPLQGRLKDWLHERAYE